MFVVLQAADMLEFFFASLTASCSATVTLKPPSES